MASFFDVMREPPVVYGSGEMYPLFNRISIETSSYCNRSCSFCPVSTGRRDFGQRLMSDDVWYRVSSELQKLEFEGVAQMFLLNEPTLDKQLMGKCVALREACPRVTMYISTNADLLLKQRDGGAKLLDEWFDAGVNCVNLNIYDGGSGEGSQHDRIWALARAPLGRWEITHHKYRRHGAKKRLVAVTDMRPERIAGDASSTDQFYDRTKEDRREGVPQRHCARPHRHVVVLYDGRVPLCCALDPTDPDLEREGLMVGDISKGDTLRGIWNSETMFRYRSHLQDARRDLPGCSTCTHRMAYSHVVRRVEIG